MTTRSTWKDALQVAAPKETDKRRASPADQKNVLETATVVPRPLRVIVREGRALRTEPVVQLALRLPESLAARIDEITAGQRHGAILKILDWALVELDRQDVTLDK